MTCKQLGGACDMEFHAETFEEMVELSKKHGAEMYETADSTHREAMQKIVDMMQEPEKMQAWQEQRRQEFIALPEDN